MRTARVRWPAWALAITLAMALGNQGAAQEGGSLRLSAPITDTFPTVRVFLDVRDAQGDRLAGLGAAEVRLTEDELPVSGISLTETEVGVRQILVLNTDSGLRLRDAGGRSRFDVVRDAFQAWWQTPAASRVGVDDLTLMTSEGPLVLHAASVAELAARLDGFQPTFEQPSPGLVLLLDALRGPAADPAPPGQTTHILFATSLIDNPGDLPIAEILRRANDLGASIHILLLGPPSALELPAAASLTLLAHSTGGDVVLLEPGGSLSALMTRITGHRTQYQLTYRSPAQAAGTHSLSAQVTSDDLTLSSPPRLFTLDLRPPEVILVSPPTEILRRPEGNAVRVEDLSPTSWPIEVLITFPDGHPRDLVRSRLEVDGQVVAEAIRPPFDRLVWDLRGLGRSETHVLSVEVEDQQGLRGVTAYARVAVEVESAPSGLAALRTATTPLLAAIGLLVAGVLGAALWAAPRRRQRALAASPTAQTGASRPALRRTRLQPIQEAHPTEAFLAWDASDAEPIALAGFDLTLGRDASLASVVLDDPSVSALHARLIRQADGSYSLKDQGSAAGTYINFEPVNESGQRLRHGDRIHIGRVALRFRLADAPPPRPVRVTSATDSLLPPQEPAP